MVRSTIKIILLVAIMALFSTHQIMGLAEYANSELPNIVFEGAFMAIQFLLPFYYGTIES